MLKVNVGDYSTKIMVAQRCINAGDEINPNNWKVPARHCPAYLATLLPLHAFRSTVHLHCKSRFHTRTNGARFCLFFWSVVKHSVDFTLIPQRLPIRAISYPTKKMSNQSTPSEYIQNLVGQPVIVKLTTGVEYHGTLFHSSTDASSHHLYVYV